ncbi:MAG: hypothetical protein SFT68_04135 [Rickettsiaceae bacterium]|nr:hypothetical protein [Rickettsiaceae bacterium]
MESNTNSAAHAQLPKINTDITNLGGIQDQNNIHNLDDGSEPIALLHQEVEGLYEKIEASEVGSSEDAATEESIETEKEVQEEVSAASQEPEEPAKQAQEAPEAAQAAEAQKEEVSAASQEPEEPAKEAPEALEAGQAAQVAEAQKEEVAAPQEGLESAPEVLEVAQEGIIQEEIVQSDPDTNADDSGDIEVALDLPLESLADKQQKIIDKCNSLSKTIEDVVQEVKNMATDTMGLQFALQQVFKLPEEDADVVKCQNLINELITFIKAMDQNQLTTAKLNILATKFAVTDLRVGFLEQTAAGLANAYNKFDLFIEEKRAEFNSLENICKKKITDDFFVNAMFDAAFGNIAPIDSQEANPKAEDQATSEESGLEIANINDESIQDSPDVELAGIITAEV